MNMPPVNSTTEIPPTKANTSLSGFILVSDANYAAPPGRYSVEVELGTEFGHEPNVILTRRDYRDETGNSLDTGDHIYGYQWPDPVNFSKLEIWVESSRLNYPPAFSYQVTDSTNKPGVPDA